MNNDKFLIIKNIKIFILSLEKLLITFPKKDMFSKNMVYQDALDILELVTKANYENRIDYKKTFQIEALSKINKIDFYLERAYKFRYISVKMKNSISLDNLLFIYEKEISKNIKNKKKLYDFEINKMQYIENIMYMLNNGYVGHNHYNIFLIYEPKCRLVMSLSFCY